MAKVEKLYWYPLRAVDALAGGDILKHDAILQLSFYEVINKLRYDKDVSDYEKRLMDIKSKRK